jgi:hypothetical protein
MGTGQKTVDDHNGSLEWMIVAVLLVTAAVVGATARRHWRLRAAASQSSF